MATNKVDRRQKGQRECNGNSSQKKKGGSITLTHRTSQGKRVLAEQTFLHCCASSVPSKRIDVEWSVVVIPLRGCEAGHCLVWAKLGGFIYALRT